MTTDDQNKQEHLLLLKSFTVGLPSLPEQDLWQLSTAIQRVWTRGRTCFPFPAGMAAAAFTVVKLPRHSSITGHRQMAGFKEDIKTQVQK